MLIRFNVKNFLSFSSKPDGNTQEFSMIAGKTRSKKEHVYEDSNIKLLKFAAVYGANAAGKSNLIKALGFMQRIVAQGLPDGHTEKYCKVLPENRDKPSYFEIEIMLDGKYYSYGFEVILSQSAFVSEWLVELKSDNSEKTIFLRNVTEGTVEFGGELRKKGLIEKLNVYAEDTGDDSSVLFLSVMNQNKKALYANYKSAAILKKVFDWITLSLDISYPNQPITNYFRIANADEDRLHEICRVISAFGTGITDFKLVDTPIEKILRNLPKYHQRELSMRIEELQSEVRRNRKIREIGFMMRTASDLVIITCDGGEDPRCRSIQFSHGKSNALFNLEEESDGTVRILDMIEILLAGEGKTFLIDELDRCLHPSLSYKFVETFLQIAAEQKVQLIVTTHESRLLDFDLLRRDEIWFINKNDAGTSDIYSLEEYNERFDKKIDKAYLEGRYGGVPVFSTVFPV